MKNFIITFSILCFLSCEKNIDKADENKGIFYQVADSNTHISSVRFFSYYGDCPSLPSPTDSSSEMSIDINGDSIQDFLFRANHFHCGSSHCSFFTYSVVMEGINNSDSIRVDEHSKYSPEKTDSIFDISQNGIWMKTVQLLLYSSCYLPFETSFTDSYIAIKIKNNYGWIHISNYGGNGVLIRETALNMTEYNSITPGQRE